MELINYFGIDSEPCGKCDNCQSGMNTLTISDYQEQVINLLKDSPKATFEIKHLVADPELFKEIIRTLMLDEQIDFDGEKYFLK